MTSDTRPGNDPHVVHIDATVLPDGEQRDLFVADRRISFDPVDDAVTSSTGGCAVPGRVDAHAHLALDETIVPGRRSRTG